MHPRGLGPGSMSCEGHLAQAGGAGAPGAGPAPGGGGLDDEGSLAFLRRCPWHHTNKRQLQDGA